MATYYFILFVLLLLMFGFIYVYKYLKRSGQKVPSILQSVKPILTIPASILVEKIRDGDLRSEQIVEAYIARIKVVNTLINAVVQERFEAALAEAREIDKRLENLSEVERKALLDSKVLLGIPFTCKESFSFQGFPQTVGLVRRRDAIASENAAVIQKMLDAGAILLAVTNVSELCVWWETSNSVYGRSRNPYNTERMVGGSSGGEAAVIAAAGSVIGIGSDVGGSIRMPAFFNGVFGHKPSPGMVPNFGQIPGNNTEHCDLLLGTGPICRYAVDLTLMLKVISNNLELTKRLESSVDISKLKFYKVNNLRLPASNVCSELLDVQEKVCQLLIKQHGVPVTTLELPLLKHSLFIWAAKMSLIGKPTFAEMLLDCSNGVYAFWELLKWCLGLSDHTIPAIGLAVLEWFQKFVPQCVQDYTLRNGENLRAEIESILGSDGVLIFPSHPTTALRHNIPILMLSNFVYTAIFNALHLPVTQVPLGLDSNGLPLGIQVVAARKNDHVTLAVAEYLEREFGGWVQP